MSDLKVIDRINKLLALSRDGGASEAEASLAAEKAQQLMLEHNLTMAVVEQTGAKAQDGNRVKEGLDRRQVYNWQKVLMQHVAELNFCHVMLRYEDRGSIYGSRTRVFNGYQLIGRAANVASTTVMFDYLVQTIDRLAKEHVQDPARYFTRYAHSFREGCSDRITDRLHERQREMVAEQERRAKEEQTRRQHPSYAGSNLPVVMASDYIQDEKELNEDLLKGLPPGTTKQRRLDYERRSLERRQAFENRLAELKAAGEDHDVAYYMASGFSRERALELVAPPAKPAKPAKPETEAQKRKRLERERRQVERDWEKRQREAKRLNSDGYWAGHDAGANVGLDQQINEDRKRRIGN